MNEFQKTKQDSGFLRLIFFSKDELRLRAGWRLALHTILILLISIPAGILIFIPVGLLKLDFSSSAALLANQLTLFTSITIATFIARQVLDKRPITSLGIKPDRQALIDVSVGIMISFFQMGLIFALEILLNWTKLSGLAWNVQPAPVIASELGIWLAIFIFVGWQEELLSRGYHLQTLASGINMFWGVIISSSVFGILHLSNPGATLFSTLGIFLAGLFLALPYILTKQLWISIGLHIGWNFFEGVVFGFPVSGLETYKLLRHSVTGPEIWTGGAFGPEAGLIIIPALLLGTLLVLLYIKSNIRATTH